MAKAFGFTYQPFWVVISRRGDVVRRGYGPSGEAELRRTIERLAGR